jgi:gluconokinase
MGVSGSGKSTLGALLAQRLTCPFLEGDSFHAPSAVAKMKAGRPLDDDDRWPWLDRLGRAISDSIGSGGVAVAACSALKRRYRERLTVAIGAPTRFVLLQASHDELLRRLTQRPGHYMPASLLDSQLAALECPDNDEPVFHANPADTPERLCDLVAAWLADARLSPHASTALRHQPLSPA